MGINDSVFSVGIRSVFLGITNTTVSKSIDFFLRDLSLFFLYLIYVEYVELRDERSLACFFLYLIYVEWKGKKSIDLETVVPIPKENSVSTFGITYIQKST